MIRMFIVIVLVIHSAELSADVLLYDEVLPLPNLTERFLGSGGSNFGAQALTTMGVDSVDSSSNGQSARRAFVAYGAGARTRLHVGDKLVVDGSAIGTHYDAESEFLDDSVWSRQESRSELVSTLIGRFGLGDGVSVGGGVHFFYSPETTDSFRISDLTAEVNTGVAKVFASEFVLTKFGSGWSAGFGWREKKSASREVKRVSAGEVVDFFEDVSLDEQISAGVSAQLQSGRDFSLDLRTVASQSDFSGKLNASAASESDPQRRYEVLGVYSLGDTGVHKLSFGLGYRTIGYSNQSNVSAQNIPLWTFLLRDKLKFAGSTVHADALFGFGEDMQSLPDFNANYRRMLLTIQAGVVL